jgi:hypothetical protein
MGEKGNAIDSLTGTGAVGGNPLEALGSLPLGFLKESPGVIRDWSEAYLRWRDVQEKRASIAAAAAEEALGIATGTTTDGAPAGDAANDGPPA